MKQTYRNLFEVAMNYVCADLEELNKLDMKRVEADYNFINRKPLDTINSGVTKLQMLQKLANKSIDILTNL